MKDLWKLTRREDLGPWLNSKGLTGTGAEIGCAYGGFARMLLSQWKGNEYLMIDPWTRQPASVYKEETSTVDYVGWFRDCEKLSKEDARIRLIRKFSVEAAKDVTDGSLDFVFIDGNHCYEAVRADLDAWWPKVKIGGLFSGHDFYDDTTRGHFCQVGSAVTQWMFEKHLAFYVTQCTGWWHVKYAP